MAKKQFVVTVEYQDDRSFNKGDMREILDYGEYGDENYGFYCYVKNISVEDVDNQ